MLNIFFLVIQFLISQEILILINNIRHSYFIIYIISFVSKHPCSSDHPISIINSFPHVFFVLCLIANHCHQLDPGKCHSCLWFSWTVWIYEDKSHKPGTLNIDIILHNNLIKIFFNIFKMKIIFYMWGYICNIYFSLTNLETYISIILIVLIRTIPLH